MGKMFKFKRQPHLNPESTSCVYLLQGSVNLKPAWNI